MKKLIKYDISCLFKTSCIHFGEICKLFIVNLEKNTDILTILRLAHLNIWIYSSDINFNNLPIRIMASKEATNIMVSVFNDFPELKFEFSPWPSSKLVELLRLGKRPPRPGII